MHVTKVVPDAAEPVTGKREAAKQKPPEACPPVGKTLRTAGRKPKRAMDPSVVEKVWTHVLLIWTSVIHLTLVT